MEFTLTINTDNAAFAQDAPGEVARMLAKAARQVEEFGLPANQSRTLFDWNGNAVGHFEWSPPFVTINGERACHCGASLCPFCDGDQP